MKTVISPKEEQKLPYDIIEFVIKNCQSFGQGNNVYIPRWVGNSDDVKEIRKMMRKVYVK